MIIVALIEDNRLVRDALSAQLNETDDVRAVGTPAAGADVVVQRTEPRVILLDAGLGEDACLRLAEEFRRDYPDANLIVTDLYPARDDIVEFVNAGVTGFIGKDASFDDLLRTIRAVADGEKVLPPDMTSALFSQIAGSDAGKGRRMVLADVRLTPRENEVVQCIRNGMANREIAAELAISEHTVKAHVRNLMEKLALRTRLQIAAYSNDTTESARPMVTRRAVG